MGELDSRAALLVRVVPLRALGPLVALGALVAAGASTGLPQTLQ
jgi:hypothetical protein